MFDSDLDRAGIGNTGRRVFLASAAAALGGLALWSWKKPRVFAAAAAVPASPKKSR